MSGSHYDEWVKYPTGKIGKGEWCDKCGRYNSRHVVGHALVIKDGRVLLVKRGHEPAKGWWAIPGGFMEWDESGEGCALRELKEETGLQGKIVGLLGVYSDPKRDKDGRQNVGLTYMIEARGETSLGEEVEEIGWFDLDKLPERIAFDHRRMIEDYARIKDSK